MIDPDYYARGIQTLCGIDEAGRGPIAGPLIVAGVVLPRAHSIKGLHDSKQLSEKQRDALFPRIQDEALAYMILRIDPAVIDEKNIYVATQDAMTEIAVGLNADYTLTDAMPLTIPLPHEAIIKGDTLSESIGAASILAKVTRDTIMKEYAAVYPGYGFDQHKGYPTVYHVTQLRALGVTVIHRKTFQPVKGMLH
jgi:ribonuclease HII